MENRRVDEWRGRPALSDGERRSPPLKLWSAGHRHTRTTASHTAHAAAGAHLCLLTPS